jgi:chromosome segregation ATPase
MRSSDARPSVTVNARRARARAGRVAALAIISIAASTADAQTARPAGNANAQAMQQMQQLASERTQLQAENAKLKQELDDAKKKLKSLEADKESLGRKSQGSEAALARLTASNETLNQSLTQQRARMDELVAKFRETLGTLRETETDRTGIKNQLATRDREFHSCVDKNLALYKVNLEVLDKLEHQGFWSSAAKVEPFTRLKRTQLENLVDEYRGKAEDQRVESPPKPPPGG